MNSLITVLVFSFVLGIVVGSFLNVVALRFNTGKSLGGRSGCFSCGHTLSWYELVPVFSWLAQRGRCRTCSSTISPQYILGEITSGIFFTLIAARGLFLGVEVFTSGYLYGTIFLFIIFSLLLVVLIYDMRHKIIPDELSVGFAAMALVGTFFFGFNGGVFEYIGPHVPTIIGILSGVIIAAPFAFLWYISDGKWIGLGDPKLMVGIGLLLGLTRGVTAIFVSFWIGTLFAISVFIVNKFLKKTLLRSGKHSIMKEELPFAPFLIIGTLCVLVFGINIFLL